MAPFIAVSDARAGGALLIAAGANAVTPTAQSAASRWRDIARRAGSGSVGA
jgi:hypothetical protein